MQINVVFVVFCFVVWVGIFFYSVGGDHILDGVVVVDFALFLVRFFYCTEKKKSFQPVKMRIERFILP